MIRPSSISSLTILSPLDPHLVVGRYRVGLAAAALAVLLRWLLDPVLGHVAFYTTVYMAVAFCALVCGWGPALLSAFVGLCGIFYWFVDPRHSLSMARRSEIHGVIGFVLVCAVLIALGEANRRKQLRLNEAHRVLEGQVRERTAKLSITLSNLESEAKVRRQAEASLRQLSVRLMRVQDEERRRIARDLHDSAGQTIAAIKMITASLHAAVQALPRAAPLIADLNALADEALQEIRTTSYLLHPPLLDESGFASAARWFAEGLSRRSGIQVECDIPQGMERLPEPVELGLFRVLQESLTNVHRHSAATLASVSFTRDAGAIQLQVSDNGRGLSPECLKRLEDAGGAGVGIAGMRERIREMGGQLHIQSNESGTTVSVRLPLSKVSLSSAGRGISAA